MRDEQAEHENAEHWVRLKVGDVSPVVVVVERLTYELVYGALLGMDMILVIDSASDEVACHDLIEDEKELAVELLMDVMETIVVDAGVLRDVGPENHMEEKLTGESLK